MTNNLRKEAEQNLKKEEMIVAARNRQVLSQQEALRNFEEKRRQAQEDREFNRSLGLRDLDKSVF